MITAQNGLECLDILKNNTNIDLILMDIMMPNMDGYETMKHFSLSFGIALAVNAIIGISCNPKF
ncbi:response regulator, partial [Bacillus sp. B-TM1]